MNTVIVLFNLKAGVERAEYEKWATSTDIPTVNSLSSVDKFDVCRATGLLISEGESPYDYIEIIHVNNMEKFGTEISTETMQKISAEFQKFSENPIFILTELL